MSRIREYKDGLYEHVPNPGIVDTATGVTHEGVIFLHTH